MAEDGVATCPQVFVVDSQANYIPLPSGRKQKWARVGQRFLLLLVGLTMLGLVIEGFLIYNLYKKTESLQVFSICASHPLCQNLSNPRTPGLQSGTILSQVGHTDSNEIPTLRPHLEQIQQRPFAQLMGSGAPVGDNSVLQWVHESETTYMMDYSKGQLLVKKDGLYYLYSKVTINAAEECSLIEHKVMKVTRGYDDPIELMKSKSFRCRTSKPKLAKSSGGEDLWNSFLAGIFLLQSGDKISVTLEDIRKIRPGSTDNLMGAFMISP